MLKKLILLLGILSLSLQTNAITVEQQLNTENTIQSRIDKIGTDILNYNKIPKRIVFTYDKKEKKSLLSIDKVLTKRQIIVYDGLYQSVQTDDELAAMLAREI